MSGAKNEKLPIQTASVAQSVFEKYFTELSKAEGFAEIAPRLKKVVMEDGVFSDAVIRAAMFPETP
jgi:hypothetical protein